MIKIVFIEILPNFIKIKIVSFYIIVLVIFNEYNTKSNYEFMELKSNQLTFC